MAIKKEKTKLGSPDILLFFITLILVIFGAIMVTSTSSVVGFSNYDDSYYFIKKHVVYLCLGAVGFFVGYRIPHQYYKKWAFNGLLLAMVPVATFQPPI